MKKLLTLILLISITSCSIPEKEIYKTNKIELRQLANTIETESSGYAALFFASYSSNERDYIKMFAKIDGFYRFLEVPMRDVRVDIRNDIDKPYIYFTYSNTYSLSTVEAIEDYTSKCVIVCLEELLPERLLPIEIKR